MDDDSLKRVVCGSSDTGRENSLATVGRKNYRKARVIIFTGCPKMEKKRKFMGPLFGVLSY